MNSLVPYQYGNYAVMGAAISGPPALPAFSNSVGCWALWNFNPVGYPSGLGIEINGSDEEVDSVAPYPLKWANVIDDSGTPPYLTDTWYDQNSNTNNLAQTLTKRPVLQITTSVVVSGAGTAAANGVYTYRGLHDQGSGPAPYYNLVGEPDDPFTVAISSNGDNGWIIWQDGDAAFYISGSEATFPWLVAGWNTGDVGVNPTPTVTPAGTQTGEIDFGTDGAGNSVITGLRSSGNLCNSTVGTIYILFKAGSLLSTEVLFETGTGAVGAARAKNISISLVAGVLTATIYDNTAVTPLANTKIKTIADTNWHFLAVTWDVTLSAANQVSLLVDNSATGVTAPISSTLVGLTIGNALLNVGARNNASSAAFTGSMQGVITKNSADDAAAQTAMYNYCKYLNPAIP